MTHSLRPEDKARHEKINPQLDAVGWNIQNYKIANVHSSKGVAVEYFQMGKDQADYVLFVNGKAVGVIEAKKEGESLMGKEPQTAKYSEGFPEDFEKLEGELPFLYESSGSEIRFTNKWDAKPRSREVFAFHKPETLEDWIKKGKKGNLRYNLSLNKEYKNKNLWPVQIKAIKNIKESLANGNPKALIQMATGSGKTFTAVNICEDLIKNGNAHRILFLVDRSNLGEQTEQEFENFEVPGDGRKFTDLHNLQLLKGNKISDSTRVCISTIQRMYSIIKGEKLTGEQEDDEKFIDALSGEYEKLEYNPKIPIETFDVIIVDECHRSIYKLWRQVLEYFDAFLIGLTATPSKGTIGFFNKNLVMEYGHEEAVADNVNVDFDVYDIRTKVTKTGNIIPKGETIIKRDKRTRQKRWEKLEDEVQYNAEELDRRVVSKDQIRTIIKTFKDKMLPSIFPNRDWVPKTLIFAKSDDHAEDILEIVREVFGEGNDFAVKITYKTEGISPKQLIKDFRTSPKIRIAVTVDMIATGTDIKPLEIVFFMRAVKSRLLFEQMKGRGVRVMKAEDFRQVTPNAVKERFVIVDAVGVLDNKDLNETSPLEQLGKKISFEKLIKLFQYGKGKLKKEHLSSMASRLSRLEKRLTEKQNKEIQNISGKKLSDFSKELVLAVDGDKILEEAQKEFGYEPTKTQIEEFTRKRIKNASLDFTKNPKLLERLPEIKRETEIILDDVTLDEVEYAGFSEIAKEKAKEVVGSFREFIKKNKDELDAIQILYKHKGKIKWKDLKSLSETIKSPSYGLTTSRLWNAYKNLEEGKVKGQSKSERIADFISLLRHEIEKTKELEPYLDTIEKRFKEWLATQKEQGVEFTKEQLTWLGKIKQHIATTAEIEADDFEYGSLQQMGGLGKAVKVFEGQEKFGKMIRGINLGVGG
ncbi:type-1 restriction enzyme R protein [archaeon BMS3Abin17]|nr:type-1 restriction enzyme R protein [archaeon BMS3Abin17]HDZ61272.1 DEAD/DEAH box helicase [Candidatus Pacearchaeota archaeon]